MPKKSDYTEYTRRELEEQLATCEIALGEYDQYQLAKNKEIAEYREMLERVSECVRVPGELCDDIELLLKKYKS